MGNEKTKAKVLITASGGGRRLGDVTKYTNKTLIRVGKKPAISYIVESYPEDTEFVVTVGHFRDQVKDFLRIAYPERKFQFAEVDNYEGEGSSLAYSMLKARQYLECPFIYHASDTIVFDQIPELDHNWVGGHEGAGSSNYSSFNVVGQNLRKIDPKGEIDPDYIYIGLAGIKDHKLFWETLAGQHKENPNKQNLGEIQAINRMIGKGIDFKSNVFPRWNDTGNTEGLKKAREEIKDSMHVLDKLEEAIFIFDKFVIKFFHDSELTQQRVERAKILEGRVPVIESSSPNFYRYKFVDGKLFSRVASPHDFDLFLEWAQDNLWEKTNETSPDEFKKVCYNFYHDKSVERIEKFLKTRTVNDTEIIINGEEVPSAMGLLEKMDFDWLCDCEQSIFHGDFIPDNILKTEDGFCLLDWRQNFGGLLKAGDMYYDLSKLNHNLTVNHDIVNSDLFTIDIDGDNVECDILRKENHVQCQRVLHDFLKEHGYDLPKVKAMTALIWLNMSPLHHHPFDLFLYYFGRLNLWRAIRGKI